MSGEWDEQQKIGWCMEDPSRLQCPETDKQKKRSDINADLVVYGLRVIRFNRVAVGEDSWITVFAYESTISLAI